MTRFTLLLFLIFPIVCFSQNNNQSKTQSSQDDRISSENLGKINSIEYEQEKSNLIGLDSRTLIELGYIDEESVTSQAPPGYSNLGNGREPCNEPYIWVDSSYTPVPRNDDGFLYIADIGFTFSFCGTTYDDLYINTNGNLSFGDPVSQYSPDGFPYPFPMVAPFWGDVDTRNTACGQAWYKLFPNYMIVSWEEVGWYNQQCNPLNTFQVIISDGNASIIGVGNNIQFRYDDMNWTTGQASGGGPFGGFPATVGYNSGDNVNFEQVGRFNVDDFSYDGPYGNNDGVHWLDYKCFVFNSAGGSILELICDDIVRSLDENCSLTITPEEVGHANIDGCSTVDLSLDISSFNCENEGDNVVTVTATSNAQTVTCTAIVTITTENCPIISIDQVGPFCEDDPIVTLTGTPPGGTWGGAAPNGEFDPSVIGPGIHTVTYLNDNSCPNTTFIDVEVFASPDVSISPDPTEFCEDDGSILLTADGTGGDGNLSYSWTTPGGNGSGPTYDAIFPGTYTVITTDGNGCSAQDETEVLVFPNPDVVIVDPGPICESIDLYTLIAAPSGGTWEGQIISPFGDIYPAQTGPGIYSVSYTYFNSFGCEGTDNIDIEITSTPFAFASNDGPYCEGDVITLYGDTNGSGANIEYSWSGPNNYSSNSQNPVDATVGGMYILQVIIDGCPSNYEVTEVLVTETPEALALNDGPYCPGNSVQLFGSTSNNGNTINYEWSGPNNYFSLEQNPLDATEGGIYDLIVTIDGCPSEPTSTEVVFSTAPDALANNSGPYCEGEVIFLSGETNASGTTITYDWSGPNNYSSNEQFPIDATEPGIYNLTVEVDGCNSDSVSTEVVINSLPQPVISGSNTFCVSGSSTLDAGIYDSYLWSDNSTGQTLEVFVEGTYIVTVTDINGCTGEDQIFVEQTESLNPVIIGDLEICEGENSILDAGIGYATYLWSNNETTQTIDVSDAQNYSVTVSDNGGCTGETTATLIINNNPTVNISGIDTFCDGGSSILDGGIFSEYLWSDNSTNQTLEVFDSGTYSLQVTDANGCTALDDIIITENPNPIPVINGPSSFCSGNTATLDGSPGYETYLWTNNETTQSITVSAGGTFGLIVTDSNGCTGETQIDVAENESLTPEIIGDLEFCSGIISILDAGAGYETYEWSNGETTQTIEVTSSGNYGVVVTDLAGCSGSDNVSTTEYNNPSPVIGGSTTYCVGGFTVLNAGAGFETYLWSNNEQTQSITISSPGNYSVEVTDQNGCTGTAFVDVEESTSLNPVISGSPSFCENDFTILDAGSGFDTYLWSDNSINQTLQVDVAGNYGITVSDGQGCTGETTISVFEVAPPFAILQTDTSVCNTEAGGSFLNLYDLIQSGDANGNWVDADNSGAAGLFNDLNFNGIPAGDYNFIYTTNSAIAPCPETSYQISVTIIDCSCPDVAFFNADPLCNGGEILDLATVENTTEEGIWSIIQTPAGGSPATINGADFDATNADPGEYVLQYDLINQPPPGCSASFFVSVFVEEGVDAGTATQPLSYCLNENESVTLTDLILGGNVGGVWTETSVDPSQGNAFDALNGTFSTDSQLPGNYTFQYTVSSSGACPDDFEEVSVIVNQLPDVIAGNGVQLNCYDPALSLDASASSSGAEYDITWTGPGVVIDGTENSLNPTVDQSGIYTLTITNNLTGCTNNDFVQVTENFDLPQVIAGNNENITCESSIVTLQAQGDVGPGFEIVWQGPGINAGNMNDLNPEVDIPGIYTITVTDLANGCTSLEDALEVFDQTDNPDIFVQSPLEALDCNVSSLDLTGGSLNNDASFQWIFDSNLIGTDEILDNITAPGIYTFIVTDNQTGCTSSESVEVFDNSNYPNAEAGNPQLLNCSIVEATLDGSSSESGPDIIYQWSGPVGGIQGSNANNSIIAVLPGTYIISVENQSNGCISTDEVVVTQDITPPNAVIANPDELDCTVNEVTLDGSSSSSGNNFIYSWTDNSGNLISNNQSVIVDNTGIYNLSVLNTENGCSAMTSINVSENPNVPYATVMSIEDPSCFGDSDGFISIQQVLGGSAPYVFSLNNDVFSNTNFYSNLGPGIYDLALEDANGCTWDTTIVIVEPIEVTLDLGPDIELEFGDSASITAFVNIPQNQIDTILWSPSEFFNCSDLFCLEGSVNTFNTMPISATIIDENGCRDSDELMVVVEKDRRVYIPTAFSPNGDGDNEIFYIFADQSQVLKINKFAVFNRWGEVMFEADNFQPNDPLNGWDGTLKNEKLNPSVFVYYAEIEFIDGHVKMYKGDVTLLK